LSFGANTGATTSRHPEKTSSNASQLATSLSRKVILEHPSKHQKVFHDLSPNGPNTTKPSVVLRKASQWFESYCPSLQSLALFAVTHTVASYKSPDASVDVVENRVLVVVDVVDGKGGVGYGVGFEVGAVVVGDGVGFGVGAVVVGDGVGAVVVGDGVGAVVVGAVVVGDAVGFGVHC